MIHEEICTYEVCKLAKEKGFDVPTFDWYDYTGNYHKGFIPHELHECPRYKEYYAPTQSLLQRWLRKEKGVVIDVVLDWQYNIEAEEIRYQYRIGSKHRMTIGGIKTRGISCDRYFATYELALEDALKYVLENLLN